MIPTDFVNGTTVSNECLEAIGFFEARRRFPHITGAGVKVLQVEYDLGTGWSSLHADSYLPAGVTTKPGYHAGEVARVIKLVAPKCWLIQMEERTHNTTLSNPRRIGSFGFPTWNPLPAEWDIENHSYTSTSSIVDVSVCDAMDKRIVRDGVIAVASSGNDAAHVKGQWHRSVHTLKIGTPHSPSGMFSRGTSRPPVPYPDRVVPTQWTSIAAPVFSACLALCVEAAMGDRAVALTALRVYPRVDHAIASLLGEPLVEPVTPPVVGPPVVVDPPVIVPPTRAELLEEAFDALEMSSVERELALSIDRALESATITHSADELMIHWSAPAGRVTLSV